MEVLESIINHKEYKKYKYSGIEWIGNIPEKWYLKKLKFLGIIYAGLNGKSGNDFNKYLIGNLKPYIPFINICNNIKIIDEQFHYVRVDTKENQNKVLKQDILFLMSSETLDDIAKCSIYLGNNEELYLNSFCKGFRILNPKINPEFINYLLVSSTYRYYFSLAGRGFTRINLKQEFINNVVALVPPLEEQLLIIKYLNRKIELIDQAISIKQKQIKLLKEHTQILIHKAVTQGLDPNVKMKDSGLEWIGKIPEHWTLIKNRGLFAERDERGNESLPVLSVSIHTAVSNEELSDEENIRGKIRIEDKSSYKIVEPNDIVFNMMRAWQGAIGAVRIKGMVSPAYIVAKSNSNILAEFFEYQYRTSSFIQQMDRFSKGITDFRKRLYWNEFKNLKTLLAPMPEQIAIVKFIESISTKILSAIALKETEVQTLKEYKSTLINCTVTGKIKVS